MVPVAWPKMGNPEFEQVRGIQSRPRLDTNKDIPGEGPFAGEPDDFSFSPNTSLPYNFVFWRWPNTSAYVVSPLGHPNTLQLIPSRLNITGGYKNYTAGYDLGDRTLVTRNQTDTLFQYSVDIDFAPTVEGEEAGVAVFLNQVQNHALGIVNLPSNRSSSQGGVAPHFRFITSALGSLTPVTHEPSVSPVPDGWLAGPIRMYIQAQNDTHYTFSAAPAESAEKAIVLGVGSAELLSGGAGDFTGKSGTRSIRGRNQLTTKS